MAQIDSVVKRVAPTDLGVLITGESGVGKEVIARRIYSESLRCDQPFVKINSAAIPDSLIESELLGHHQGAFTGANATRKGLVQTAHQGTLFLDEIAELNPESQSKILHIIHDKEFTPLGSNKSVNVDVRILAATNRDLLEEVESGRFHKELYYRLNVVHIQVPPLRKCKEDIPGFIDYFLDKYVHEFKKADVPVLEGRHYKLMSTYEWPGNVRELENFVKNLILVEDSRSAFAGLTSRIRGSAVNTGVQPSLLEASRRVEAEVERKVIGRVLKRNGWHRKKTAQMLQISYRSLLSKIKKLEIE
jgi:transcriptional regulator with PAS, ATPase and Fis domain